MATTESRPGFRLPWSADRAPSNDGFEDETHVAPQAVADSGPVPDDAVDAHVFVNTAGIRHSVEPLDSGAPSTNRRNA